MQQIGQSTGDLTNAIKALAAAVRDLAGANSGQGLGMLLATIALAVATVGLVVVTLIYTRHTKAAAKAAQATAELMQSELLEATTPRIAFGSKGDQRDPGDGAWHLWDVVLYNIGGGPAMDPRVHPHVQRPHRAEYPGPVRDHMWIDNDPYPAIHQGGQYYPCQFRYYEQNWREKAGLVVVCHYQHRHTKGGQRQVYHTVYVEHVTNGNLAVEPPGYYGPGLPPLPQEYADLCLTCKGETLPPPERRRHLDAREHA